MPYPDDKNLVERSLQGDCDAFAGLINRYKYAVYGICLSLIGDFDLAEDMAQEAFIKAFLRLNSLDTPDRFGNWLRIIAVNECRLYLRRNHPGSVPVSRIPETEIPHPECFLPADRQSDLREQTAGRQHLEAATLHALGHLSEKNRQALTLYYLVGYSIEQVARFLGISIAAVKMRLHRARGQLQKEAVKMVQTTLSEKELGPDFEDRIRPVNATAFFSDIAGFASINDLLSARELVSLLNEYLEDMTEIVERHHGTLDKYEGDAIMASWGALNPCDDHAAQACLAALDMEKKLAEWRRQDKPDLTVRYGINTGQIFAGDMGSRQFRDYTILGHHVNLAARLERVNNPYGTHIMISEHTLAAAVDAIEARELDTIQLPGQKLPVIIYEVLAKKGQLDQSKTRLISLYQEGLKRYKKRHWEKAAAAFEQGREFYQKRDWKQALVFFNKALQLDPQDDPSSAFKTRCETFLNHPPEWLTEDWDGTYVL